LNQRAAQPFLKGLATQILFMKEEKEIAENLCIVEEFFLE